MMKEICFIAQFPPPMHGLSKAVQTLYNAPKPDTLNFKKVDITNNKNIIRNLRSILRSNADLFYFTISQTRMGNLRDLLILKLIRLKKKKCIVHLHGGYYRTLIENDMSTWQRKKNYNAIHQLAGVIVLSDSLKKNFEGLIDEKKIFVVPNCVDNEFLISEEEFTAKKRALIDKPILHVLYLSNFIKSKGYYEVLQMARIEKERIKEEGHPHFYFDFAGKFFDKDEERDFIKFIDDNDLQDIVTYHGIVGGLEKRELLKKSDIFVLLTRYPNEGQPISILEAMGNGLSIISTDHAGIPDIVVDGDNGSLISKEQQNEINGLYKCLRCTEKIMINNRTLACEKFSQQNYLRNMINVFSEVL